MGNYVYEPAIYKKIAYKIYKLFQIAGLRKEYHRGAQVLENQFLFLAEHSASAALDIGSGPEPKNPFKAARVYGADLRENKGNNVVYADISSGSLPFESASLDYVTAHDVLEHIMRVSIASGKTRFPLILLMNEIFRVLKPGGIFFSMQPCFPFKEAFQDPTHVNIMTEDTLQYYFCEQAWARIYGFEGSFEMIRDGWLFDKYFSFMKKSAIEPVKHLEFVPK